MTESFTPKRGTRNKTLRSAVEQCFAQYRLYKYTDSGRAEAVPSRPALTNRRGDAALSGQPAADKKKAAADERLSGGLAASVGVDAAQRSYVCECVDLAVDQLPEKQRQLLRQRYMRRNLPTDAQLCSQLGITRQTLHARRDAAFAEIAGLLAL